MRHERLILVFIVLSLISLGVVMIYSSSAVYAYELYGDTTYFLKRHLITLFFGFVGFCTTLVVPYPTLRRYAKAFLLVSILFLILVLVPPFRRQIGGASRWFRIGSFNFQPSEAAKIALLIYLADYLTRKRSLLSSFKEGFLPPFLVVGAIVLLILVQPDLGTAFALFALSFLLFFVAGIRPRVLLSCMLSGLPVFVALILAKPYRMRRMIAFMNPEQDPLGAGFQVIQSKIALGSGGWTGLGLGQSHQKLFYLPASHTDFIFSIVGEELGFLGTLAVVGLFFLFTALSLRILKRVREGFGRLLGLGLTLMITLEVLVNIAVTCAAIPTKGLPLPFVSYGGSALLFNLIAVGLLFNISKYGSESLPTTGDHLESPKGIFRPARFYFRPVHASTAVVMDTPPR